MNDWLHLAREAISSKNQKSIYCTLKSGGLKSSWHTHICVYEVFRIELFIKLYEPGAAYMTLLGINLNK